jgi:large subunit ribosomal protein L21
MSKIAIIKTGGKQYKVKPGDKVKVEKINGEVGDQVDFTTLATFTDDAKDLNLGTPTLDSTVQAKIVTHGKNPKIRVVHYKAKTRHHKVYGHKQPFTQVEIVNV